MVFSVTGSVLVVVQMAKPFNKTMQFFTLQVFTRFFNPLARICGFMALTPASFISMMIGQMQTRALTAIRSSDPDSRS